MDTFKGSQDAEKRSENGSAAQRFSNQFLCAGLIAERFRRLADCLVRIRGFVAQGKKGGNGILVGSEFGRFLFRQIPIGDLLLALRRSD